MADAEHHLAQDDEHRADDEEQAEVSGVVDGPRRRSDNQQQKRLDGADPAYRRRVCREELAGFVVCLVDAKGVDGAPVCIFLTVSS